MRVQICSNSAVDCTRAADRPTSVHFSAPPVKYHVQRVFMKPAAANERKPALPDIGSAQPSTRWEDCIAKLAPASVRHRIMCASSGPPEAMVSSRTAAGRGGVTAGRREKPSSRAPLMLPPAIWIDNAAYADDGPEIVRPSARRSKSRRREPNLTIAPRG
jgi:hypothetical protein